MKDKIKKDIPVPEKVAAQLDGTLLKIKGPKGEVERNFAHPKIRISVSEKDRGKIALFSEKATKKEKMIINSFAAHIKNAIKGVQEGHFYKLKICSGHFPMTVSVSGNELTIKNFFGETVPRKMSFPKGVEVKVTGNEIAVTSPDIELAGQTAGKIERLCRITGRDIRVFQDGCYIVQKSE